MFLCPPFCFLFCFDYVSSQLHLKCCSRRGYVFHLAATTDWLQQCLFTQITVCPNVPLKDQNERCDQKKPMTCAHERLTIILKKTGGKSTEPFNYVNNSVPDGTNKLRPHCFCPGHSLKFQPISLLKKYCENTPSLTYNTHFALRTSPSSFSFDK